MTDTILTGTTPDLGDLGKALGEAAHRSICFYGLLGTLGRWGRKLSLWDHPSTEVLPRQGTAREVFVLFSNLPNLPKAGV
jgi:hypothetical protein